MKTVFITGGAGYVGSALVPKLLARGYKVIVYDLYLYGREVFPNVAGHAGFTEVQGDIRDAAALRRAMEGADAVIHLACISNDPSFDLDPALGKSINFDAFRPLVRAAKECGVKRFLNASSSSVYGIKTDPKVTEDLPLEPITDYGKYKALCEGVLAEERVPGFVTVSVRPASLMGYAPRQRLDLTVNMLTAQALVSKKITVFGGSQKRPNLHMDDMTDLYALLLEAPAEAIDGKVFNVNCENETVMNIAERVRNVLGKDISIEVSPTKDLRSYYTSTDKIRRELGFVPKKTIEDAVAEVAAAIRDGRLTNPLDNEMYYNVRRMKNINLR